MSSALLIYADGSEDLEITAAADILKRGGVEVIRAALTDNPDKIVTLAHGTKVICDKTLGECDELYDVVVIPGGLKGSEACRDSERLIDILAEHKRRGRHIAAICAAPGFVLHTHGFLDGVKATCYPGCNDARIQNLKQDGVVYDERAKIVTGKGPGYAVEFALKILEILQGRYIRDRVAAGMLLD